METERDSLKISNEGLKKIVNEKEKVLFELQGKVIILVKYID